MNGLKTILFYLLGLAGLITASFLFTGTTEVEVGQLPGADDRASPPSLLPTAPPAPCGPTPKVTPYEYRPDAPLTTTLTSPGLPGDHLTISGTIYAADCATPLSGVLIEVWHTSARGWQGDADGNYKQAGLFTLRAQMKTDAKGGYSFTTRRPASQQKQGQMQAAHIHYRLSYPAGNSLMATALYFADDAHLSQSPSIDPALITTLTSNAAAGEAALKGAFDIVLPIDASVRPNAAAGGGRTDCALKAGSLNSNNVYLPNAPFTTALAPAELPGERLVVSGTVYGADKITPLPHILLEVWQTDAEGRYSHGNRFTLRGQMRSDSQGRYRFSTIKPGYYRVGCQFQPAHIHFRISTPDARPFFTSLFFEADPYLAVKPSIDPALIRPLTLQPDEYGYSLHTTFDIVYAMQ